MLNYAYALLESHVRTQVVAQGFDATIGYLHSYKPERPAFVLDLMEPLRPNRRRTCARVYPIQEISSGRFHNPP
jgi:CRISPR/Cas system-associated endonuclease Cas1